MGEFDSTRRNDPAYWAAAAVVADRAGDSDRAQLAREQLERLGYTVEKRSRSTTGKGGDRD
jgi:hypothetical protein